MKEALTKLLVRVVKGIDWVTNLVARTDRKVEKKGNHYVLVTELVFLGMIIDTIEEAVKDIV